MIVFHFEICILFNFFAHFLFDNTILARISINIVIHFEAIISALGNNLLKIQY